MGIGHDDKFFVLPLTPNHQGQWKRYSMVYLICQLIWSVNCLSIDILSRPYCVFFVVHGGLKLGAKYRLCHHDQCLTLLRTESPAQLSPYPSLAIPLSFCLVFSFLARSYGRIRDRRMGVKNAPLSLMPAAHKIGLHSFVSRTMHGTGCLRGRWSGHCNLSNRERFHRFREGIFLVYSRSHL